MDIPGDRISKKPKVTFSKQDSRHNPTPEEKSISQMMEDLGDHRIINLPLSGARVLGTAPSPNPEKGGAQNAQMALKSDHMEAWAEAPSYLDLMATAWAATSALFDPSLVIGRNDGLGEGQSYRAGPNYLPIRESKFKYPPKWHHYRSGSDTPIPPFGRGQTIPSQATRSLQIRGDLNKATLPTASQHPRRAFQGRPVGHGNGIPPKGVMPAIGSTPLVPLSSLARLSSIGSSRNTRKVPDNPSVNHWHTGNLMTADQDLYDYIQPKIGANKSTDPLVPKAEAGKRENIQPTLKQSTTTTNALCKTDSPQSNDVAFHKSELEKFAEAPPAAVLGINSEARQELVSQSAAAEIANRETREIAQVASQFAPKASSDSGGKLSDTSDAGSLESRQNSNPESKPNTNLQTIFESLENEMQLTTRALLGYSFDSHDYEIKETSNKTRLKVLTDKINAADNLLSEEMAKIYEFKTSLQDIKSRTRMMADDFLKIKMEHDEFLVKRKRIAETEADKKAADEFALKNRVDVQPQVELRKKKLLQEEQRLEEKRQLEKRWQEEKRLEEKSQEEKRQEEEKLLEEKRQEEKHQEEKLLEEKRQEEKLLEEKRQEDKLLEEKRQEDKLLEEKRQEEKLPEEKRQGDKLLEEKRQEEKLLGEKRQEEKRQEEKLLEEKRQEEKRQEEKLLEEKRQEEKRLEEKRLEEKRQEEKRLEEKRQEEKRQEEKRQEKRLEEKRLEEKRLEEKRLEEKRLEEKRLEEKRLEEKRLEEKRLEEKRLEELRLEAERLEQQRLERRRRDNQRIEKWQQGSLQGDEQPQKEKQRGLDRLRYEKQQLIEKQRLDKLLNDERVKAEQTEVRRLAAQRMEGHPLGECQERKHAQNEAEKMLTRERLGGDKGLGINGLDEYTDPYGRGRIEAENAHEKFREITQVRAGHPKGGPSTQRPLKEVPHSVSTHPAAHEERQMPLHKESSDLGNAKLNQPLFPYKLHLQLTPLFKIPSITAWVGRLADPTVEIEKAIRQHLSDDEMKVLKNVEAYKQFLTRATDHHTRRLAKDSK
ncbi:hypothetical protein HOY80DRAFT_1084952 [Tuber brumale]|nr:hypothetical protein HOY80DRAFT_1084952 [Tuber brumale]